MKKTIATLAPIGPYDDWRDEDFAEVITQMRTIVHPDFPSLDAERAGNMRSACVASVLYGVEAQLVADYGRPVRGWPATPTWEVSGLGTAFVSREINAAIDRARMALDVKTLSRQGATGK
jgi:hypothetical protein